jgi:hypothetical protein
LFSKKHSINILSPSNVVLAKNLVGKQFSKGFFATEDAFENLKKEIKKIPFQVMLKQRSRFSGVRTINAIGIAISKS